MLHSDRHGQKKMSPRRIDYWYLFNAALDDHECDAILRHLGDKPWPYSPLVNVKRTARRTLFKQKFQPLDSRRIRQNGVPAKVSGGPMRMDVEAATRVADTLWRRRKRMRPASKAVCQALVCLATEVRRLRELIAARVPVVEVTREALQILEDSPECAHCHALLDSAADVCGLCGKAVR